MDFTIRQAEADDPDWIVARHGVLYPAEFGFDAGFGHDIAAKMKAFLAKDDAFKRIWIAEADNERLGSIAISQIGEGTAFLNFVLVEPAARGRGIAAAMMDTAFNHARQSGFSFVRLETYSCLKDARALYARHGFEIIESRAGIEKYGQSFDVEFWLLGI